MFSVGSTMSVRPAVGRQHTARAFAPRVLAVFAALWLLSGMTAANAADPAVVYMSKVGRDLMAAARTRSPGVMANAIQRHGDIAYIGLYSLGSYRAQLAATDHATYYSGMVRFISRYAAGEAPKYPVARVEWADQSTKASNGGIFVDSKIVIEGGGEYDVRWLLAKHGNSYKVRDAMVLGLWMTPFLKKLFEDYIAQNGGNPRALLMALNH